MKYSVLLVVTISALMPAAKAEVELTFSGQIRTRWELDKKSFVPSTDPNEFGLLRTRLGVLAKVNENVSGFIQLQDSRVIGGLINGQSTSGTFSDSKNIDLHQGYFVIDQIWRNGPGIRAGRFELNFGNGRVVESGSWSNIGRSYEGLVLEFNCNRYRGSLFYIRRHESVGTTNLANEISFSGINVSFPKAGTELLLIGNINNQSLQSSPESYLERRFHTSVFTEQNIGPLSIEGNAAYQFGQANSVLSEPTISAYMVQALVLMSIDTTRQIMFGAGADYSSGDQDRMDGTAGRYDDLFSTSHRIRGIIDVLDTPPASGMFDYYGRLLVVANAARSVKLTGDVHLFMADPRVPLVSRNYGTEFDLVSTITALSGVSMEFGAAVLFPGDYFSENNDPAYWGYGAMTVDF